MKLFARYNRVNLVATVIIFLLASIAFYFVIRSTLIAQLDDTLLVEYGEIHSYVQKHDKLPEIIRVADQDIKYSLLDHSFEGIRFTSFNGYDSVEKVNDPFRKIEFSEKVAGNNYLVTVAKSLEGTDDLLKSILVITLSTILLILAASLVINRIVLKRLWRPFYETLNKISSFSLSKNEPLNFGKTSTEEFNLMNRTFETVSRNARNDYSQLKEFTENASHEMQTPLAIIRSKLDLLIQDEHLSENQSVLVQNVHESIDKLSKINQSLLLLAKIGNRQYESISTVDLKKMLDNKISAFQDLWLSSQLHIDYAVAPSGIQMNEQLTDILLNNLLSNATKHNYPGGRIEINLVQGQLVISNTSHSPALDPAKVFTRFYTPDKGMSDHGLGLSIIRQIADTSSIQTVYKFENGIHSFILTW